MLSSHTVSPYNQRKSAYLNTDKYPPKYRAVVRIQEDRSLHALYLRESEFLNAGKITPTSQKEEADLKVKKAIVGAINSNDTKTLQRLLKRSSVETKRTEGHDIHLSDTEILARETVNLYSLIYLANQPHCRQQTRETIYHCLTGEKNYLRYVSSFFKTEMIEITYHTDPEYPSIRLYSCHLAAALNLKNIVEQLFEAYGFTICSCYSTGYFSSTALGLAAAFGHLEMVKFLYSKGAELNPYYTLVTFGDNATPSFIAYVTLIEKHDDLTRCLLDNTELEDPINFLHVAAHYNNLPILKYAFEKFKISFSTLIEKNAYPIIFALIEAGVELPDDAPEDLHDAALLWQKEAMLASTATPAAAASISQAPTDSGDYPVTSTSSQRPL